MIESPWIILMIDRTRLGSAMYAVARPRGKKDPFVDKIRRTQRILRAMRYATVKRARTVARKLARSDHKTLFIVIALEPGDFGRPLSLHLDEPARVQSTMFPIEDVPR